MPTGQARVRLVDVATRAGVSATVVSAVLRDRQGGTIRVAPAKAAEIRGIAQRMGYRPNIAAQLLKGRPSDVIGVLIGAESTPANYERLSALEQEAGRRGLRLMIGQFRESADRTLQYLNDFADRGIEALVCFHNPLPADDPRIRRAFARVKHAVFQTEALLPGALCVDVDRAAGVGEAVAYLQRRGRQRIALLLNSNPDPLMQDRRRGYRSALQTANPSHQKEIVFFGTGQFPPPPQLLTEAVKHLVIERQADAIIASNDVWAMLLIKALRRQQIRVPQDVAVIGFDNLPAAEWFDPALTTIDQNNAAFADAAMDMLRASLNGEELKAAERHRVVLPKLIIREST